MTSIARYRDQLLDLLFDAEKRRLDNAILHFIDRNAVFNGNRRSPGFIHQGLRYVPWCYRDQARGQRLPTLSFQLMGEAQSFVADAAIIHRDQEKARQFFTLLFAPCETLTDVRNALPDSLLRLDAQRLTPLPRTREPLWPLHDNPRQLRQFREFLPRLEMYAVSGMMY